MQQVITRTQLAELYGISRRTLYEWCKKGSIELNDRELITPKCLKEIFEKYGNPYDDVMTSHESPTKPNNTHTS
jgi:Helix-turn-helix domain